MIVGRKANQAKIKQIHAWFRPSSCVRLNVLLSLSAAWAGTFWNRPPSWSEKTSERHSENHRRPSLRSFRCSNGQTLPNQAKSMVSDWWQSAKIAVFASFCLQVTVSSKKKQIYATKAAKLLADLKDLCKLRQPVLSSRSTSAASKCSGNLGWKRRKGSRPGRSPSARRTANTREISTLTSGRLIVHHPIEFKKPRVRMHYSTLQRQKGWQWRQTSHIHDCNHANIPYFASLLVSSYVSDQLPKG